MSRVVRKLIFPFNSPGALCVIGFLGLTGASQFRLQGLERKSTLALANKANKYFVTKTDSATRGSIYSREMKPMAEDAHTYLLDVSFASIPHTPGFAVALSEASGIPAQEFMDRDSGTRSWPAPLTVDQYKAISKVKKDWLADGVSISSTHQRTYPLGVYAGALVGTQKSGAKPDDIRRNGLESSLNDDLRGIDGKRKGLLDKNGEFLPMRSFEASVTRVNGSKIVTTIDAEIQASATNAVRRAVEKNFADDGVAIVLQPKTGEVLAVSTWPVSDPNSNLSFKSDGQNPAYMKVLEPGSTFKILTLAKAINDGVISEGQFAHCDGQLNIGTKSRIRCDEHHGNRAHGDLDPEKAIAKSCNVSAAIWGRAIGEKDFYEYLLELGLRETTGLNLHREAKGRIVPDEHAKALQLATWSFGQSMTASPIALAGAFATVANNGVRMPLSIVKSVDGKEVSPKQGVEVLSKKACDYTLHCMESVVMSEGGTGKTLRIPGYRIGGKTGTAQKIGKGGASGYVSNFVGVIPADKPEVLILIMINNPKGKKFYGADVAGPVFVDVAKTVITELGIKPSVADVGHN
jgi:cell division protein FtsI/penicillin-binding protein 2